jgi:hypothetical protein
MRQCKSKRSGQKADLIRFLSNSKREVNSQIRKRIEETKKTIVPITSKHSSLNNLITVPIFLARSPEPLRQLTKRNPNSVGFTIGYALAA